MIAEYGRAAAAQAAAAGAHTQAILFYERVLARRQMLDLSTQAEVLQAMTESLFLVDRMAGRAGRRHAAIALREQQGEREALGEVYCALGPIYWITARSDDALDAAARAVDLLRARRPVTPARLRPALSRAGADGHRTAGRPARRRRGGARHGAGSSARPT